MGEYEERKKGEKGEGGEKTVLRVHQKRIKKGEQKKKSDRMKQCRIPKPRENSQKMCGSEQIYLPLEGGKKRECGEQPLFYSHLLRTDKLPEEMTSPSPLPGGHSSTLRRPIYLIPDNSAACPSVSPYSNSRVGQSTEPCNEEIFAVTWRKG